MSQTGSQEFTGDLAESGTGSLAATVQVGELRSAVEAAQRTVVPSPTLVAYTGVLIATSKGRLTVTASDGETTTAVTLATPGCSPGKVLVTPKPLLIWLASNNKTAELTLTAERSDLLVKTIDSKPYRFRGLSATFPDPRLSRSGLKPVDLSALPDAVKAVSHASDSSVRLRSSEQGLWLETTDYHRAAAFLLKGVDAGDLTALAPLAPVVEMSRHTVTMIGLDARGKELRAASDSVWIATRLNADSFPEVDALVASTPQENVKIDTNALRSALRRLSSVADGAPAKLTIAHQELVLETHNGEVGDGIESVKMSGDGSGFKCAVAVTYLADAVAAHPSGEITLRWSDPERPLYLESESGTSKLVTIVMPVRV